MFPAFTQLENAITDMQLGSHAMLGEEEQHNNTLRGRLSFTCYHSAVKLFKCTVAGHWTKFCGLMSLVLSQNCCWTWYQPDSLYTTAGLPVIFSFFFVSSLFWPRVVN